MKNKERKEEEIKNKLSSDHHMLGGYPGLCRWG